MLAVRTAMGFSLSYPPRQLGSGKTLLRLFSTNLEGIIARVGRRLTDCHCVCFRPGL